MPLKILSDFSAEQEWVLEPGDMLYLPPQYAHDGVAEGECMTASIGFRAPAYRELAGHFLAWLSETVEGNEGLDGRYADAGETATEHPAQMPAGLGRAVTERLQAMKWNGAMVSEFLGSHLSELKAIGDVRRGRGDSAAQVHEAGPGAWRGPCSGSIALYDRTHFFLNGEAYEPPASLAKWLRRLADHRHLTASEVSACAALPDLMDTFHDWTLEGWLQIAPVRV